MGFYKVFIPTTTSQQVSVYLKEMLMSTNAWMYNQNQQIFCFVGHIWEAGEWTKRNKHQPGSIEEELPRAYRTQAYSPSNTTVLWWGLVIFIDL